MVKREQKKKAQHKSERAMAKGREWIEAIFATLWISSMRRVVTLKASSTKNESENETKRYPIPRILCVLAAAANATAGCWMLQFIIIIFLDFSRSCKHNSMYIRAVCVCTLQNKRGKARECRRYTTTLYSSKEERKMLCVQIDERMRCALEQRYFIIYSERTWQHNLAIFS